MPTHLGVRFRSNSLPNTDRVRHNTPWALAAVLLILTGAVGARAATPCDAVLPARQLSPLGKAGPSGEKLTFERLFALREIGGVTRAGISVSPDGKRFAFLLSQRDRGLNTYRTARYVSDLAGKTVCLGDGGEAELFRQSNTFIASLVRWSPDGKWIAYLKRISGIDQIWLVNAETGIGRQLTHSQTDAIDFRWTEDGRAVAAWIDSEALHRRREETSEGLGGFHPDGRREWSWARARPAPASPLFDPAASTVRRIDIATGAEAAASDGDIARLATPFGLSTLASPTHSAEATLMPIDPAFPGPYAPARLAVRRPIAGGSVPCSDPRCAGAMRVNWSSDTARLRAPFASLLAWDHDGREVYVTRKEGAGKSAIYAWDLNTGRVRTVTTKAESLFGCAPAAGAIVCIDVPPDRPRRIVTVDVVSGRITPIIDANPEFQRIRRPQAELLTWTSGERTAHGWLISPPGAESRVL